MALRRLPEFAGYNGRTFPGQVSPRHGNITPRRLDLPPTFSSEWKKIGFKKTKMNTIKIVVTPADNGDGHQLSN